MSYPTIRARLDRLINRLQQLRSGQPVSALRELLAGLVEKPEICPAVAKRILETHKKELDEAQET